MYFVYIIKNELGRHYIGHTQNIEQRLFAHNHSTVKSTKNRGLWGLVISFELPSRSEAMKLEKKLKELKNSHKAIEFLRNMRSVSPPDGNLRASD